ncbi:hypothetical protein [Nocardiopsis rhodophaea]
MSRLMMASPSRELAEDAIVELAVHSNDVLGMSSRYPTYSDIIVAAGDLSFAVLITADGYSLAAGGKRFVGAFFPEGVDAAKVRFMRQGKKLAEKYPALADVALDFPPRHNAWSALHEVDPGSHVARQIELMRSFSRGDMPSSEFVHYWQEERRRSLAEGERVRGALEIALEEVFNAMEDYSPYVELRDDGDLTDAEFAAQIRSSLATLDSREGGSG